MEWRDSNPQLDRLSTPCVSAKSGCASGSILKRLLDQLSGIPPPADVGNRRNFKGTIYSLIQYVKELDTGGFPAVYSPKPAASNKKMWWCRNLLPPFALAKPDMRILIRKSGIRYPDRRNRGLYKNDWRYRFTSEFLIDKYNFYKSAAPFLTPKV